MTDVHVPDISKWQASVDFSKVGPAVILRAHSGNGVDSAFAAREPQARAHQQVIGFYGYVVEGRDAATQGREFAAAVGKLRTGEFAVCDLETGSGDQSARAEAWCHAVDVAIGGHAWGYSGEAFDHDHLTHVSGRRLWIAAYRAAEPTGPHALWQHTDSEPHPGIGACDCSIFHGTIQQLHDLISPPTIVAHATTSPTPIAPPPPRPDLETDMSVIYAPGKPTALLAGGKVIALASNAEKDAYAAAGHGVHPITAAQFDLLVGVAKRAGL